jgi:hypothetical protein
MQSLTLEELDTEADRFDAAVMKTPYIDLFCSSADWILPAHAALMPPREPWVFSGHGGYLCLARGTHPDGWSYLQPLEAAWGLACPFLGSDPARLVTEAVRELRGRQLEWDLLLLSGVKPRTPLFDALARQLAPHFGLRLGKTSRRHIASLAGGLDGFLSRRPRNLRKGLRRALRRAERDGIVFEKSHLDEPSRADEHYERIMRIERRSWKGREGVGVDTGDMCEFYRLMNRRLIARGTERVVFARHRDRDVAYVLGAVFGETYRGLQFSYDADYGAYSLGNLCQYWQIAELCEQGYRLYDLGAEIDYKLRWGEELMETVLLIVVKQ